MSTSLGILPRWEIRWCRVVQALERIGSDEARKVLGEIGTDDARQALQRLRKRDR